jgi:hypothetical protein
MKISPYLVQTPELRRKAFSTAFFAGVLGAVTMSVLYWVFRAIGWSEMNLSMLLGSMLTGNTGAGTWVLGFMVHLALGGVFALAYAYAFHNAGNTGREPERSMASDTGSWAGLFSEFSLSFIC